MQRLPWPNASLGHATKLDVLEGRNMLVTLVFLPSTIVLPSSRTGNYSSIDDFFPFLSLLHLQIPSVPFLFLGKCVFLSLGAFLAGERSGCALHIRSTQYR